MKVVIGSLSRTVEQKVIICRDSRSRRAGPPPELPRLGEETWVRMTAPGTEKASVGKVAAIDGQIGCILGVIDFPGPGHSRV